VRYVSGREVVEANGGKVVLPDMVEGKSTTGTIEKTMKVYGKAGEGMPKRIVVTGAAGYTAKFYSLEDAAADYIKTYYQKIDA
jgi:hypothetical protein